MDLKEALKVQTHAKVYKHQCHCAYNSEIETCTINAARRQATQKKKLQ